MNTYHCSPCPPRRPAVAALTDGRCSGAFTPDATVAARHADARDVFVWCLRCTCSSRRLGRHARLAAAPRPHRVRRLRRGDAGSHASPADDSGRPRRLARLGRAAKAAAARWMAARSGPRCSSLPALLTVRVIAIEMCPRLAPVLPPPRTRPPRCSGNRPQDTQNKPHRYSLLQRNSGVNHPTTRIRGRPTPCRRRPATALPDAHLARGSLPILRRIVSGGGWRCDQGRAMG